MPAEGIPKGQIVMNNPDSFPGRAASAEPLADSGSVTLGGRYDVRGRIARGGMADVFLALDRILNRPVAVKVLAPNYAADQRFVDRFRREATSAANLNHPNIVQVYDWGSHDGTYFIAMELVEGDSLAQILATERRLEIGQAIEVAKAVAAALGYAHAHEIVHRDVKPGNILITRSGEVKVADFGIARALGGDIDLTETGKVMGTAAYFSPEQAQGGTVGSRADLYSLGVVLFEMVTGSVPFDGPSPASVAEMHVMSPPPRAASVNPAVPAELDQLIASLLTKDPGSRYPAARELEADLARVGTALRSPPPAMGGGQADGGRATRIRATSEATARACGAFKSSRTASWKRARWGSTRSGSASPSASRTSTVLASRRR